MRAPVEHVKQVKKCTRCNEEKPVDQFCKNSRSFDGRYSQCRTCVADKVSCPLCLVSNPVTCLELLCMGPRVRRSSCA